MLVLHEKIMIEYLVYLVRYIRYLKCLQHEKEFLEILDAVKGTTNEKRLASQFIARFFKHFPDLAEQAIDSILDLCEDDDVSVSLTTLLCRRIGQPYHCALLNYNV